MSPSPSSGGGLVEVERYVGACLITHNRYTVNNREFFARQQHLPPSATDTVPFISNNLAQLAIHTHGAPLIVYKNNRRNVTTFSNPHQHRARFSKAGANPNQRFTNSQRYNKQNVDSISVTSAGSDTTLQTSKDSLPRIIRPRKRRKKERKPMQKESLIKCNETNGDSCSTKSSRMLPFIYSLTDSVAAPISDVDADVFCPKLHHSFEDVKEVEEINTQSISTCQCRYCDPHRQIWDVAHNCNSSNSNSSSSSSSSSNSSRFLTFSSSSSSKYDGDDDDYGLSDSISKISLNENNRNSSIFSRSNSSSSTSSYSSASGDLQVSTEIVTSLNGHRDLEIKFWLKNDNVVSCE